MKDYFKLLRFVRPYKGLFVFAALCMIITTLFDGISLGMIVPLSDRVLTDKEIIIPQNVPPFVSQLVARLNVLSPMAILKGMVLAIILLFFLKGVVFFFQTYLMNVIGQRCIRDVRNRIYKKFHELSLDFYSRKRTGELISRITNDVGLITQAISYGLTDLVYQSLQIILFAFLVFYIYWKLALISFVMFPLVIFPVVVLGRRIKKFSLETQKKMADLNSRLTETIQGAYIVKVFCREDYEFGRFKEVNQQHYKYILKCIKRTTVLSPLTEFIGIVGAALILLIAGRDVIEGRLSFGVFGLFLGSLMSMIRPFKKLSGVHAINQQALSASQRIYDILDEVPSIKEKEHAVAVGNFDKGIVFDHVWFTYAAGEGYVLSDISLAVKKNEVLAIVGPSGAGKSTLISLVPRLYDTTRGLIAIDGRDVRDFKLCSLRSLISVVSQDTVIFNDSIRGNIAYGKDNATPEEIADAAKKAYAFDFVNQLPDGFDTVVGDRGFRLSGGQKQRIAIARAFLKDAPVLILDEATSHLDSESENLIKKAMYELMKGKTVFVVAHRLSTVQHATKIVVLQQGRVIEQGTHAELIESSTVYKKLYELQFDA